MIWDSRESFRNRDVQRTSIRKKLVLVFCKYGGLYERKMENSSGISCTVSIYCGRKFACECNRIRRPVPEGYFG